MNPTPSPEPSTDAAKPSRTVIDIHLHLVALDPDDAETHGGWFSATRRHTRAFRWIRRMAGLPETDEGFDADFRALLGRLLSEADAMARNDGFSGGYQAVGLAFDQPHDIGGLPMAELADFYVPDAYAQTLSRRQPHTLRFGASIHPYRPDALEALERAVRNGAALVKWLPTSQEIDPDDPRTIAFTVACRRLGIPLLIHTGSEGATRNPHPERNNPRTLAPLLDTGATVIAAHCGMRSLPHEGDHFKDWVAMLPDWPNLYGDTAALFGLRPRKLIRALDKPLVVDRLLHGSDWPVPNWPGWHWPGLGLGTIRRLCRIKNPLWRDVATKRAAGLPDAIFTRAASLLIKGGEPCTT